MRNWHNSSLASVVNDDDRDHLSESVSVIEKGLSTPILLQEKRPNPVKPSIRQKLLIAVGISAGLLASFDMFAQNAPAKTHTITSQTEYAQVVESVEELASKLYEAHMKYPSLTYTHIYNSDGTLMGFNVTGVPQSAEADRISVCLVQLELLGNAVNNVDQAYLPSSNTKLTSRVSKKRAIQSPLQETTETTALVSETNPNEVLASSK